MRICSSPSVFIPLSVFTCTDPNSVERLHLHLHLYVDPSLIDYYSTGLTSGGNTRKDENKENIGSKK